MAPRLVERDEDLTVLESALAAAEAGAGGVVLVSGPAGIGKTSLLRVFLDGLTPRVRVLVGACDDLLTPQVWGPLREAAHGVVPALDRALGEGDRTAVPEALLDALAAAPTVLAIEDVHWADDATLDVLRLVGRRIARLPSLLVLTYRDDEVGSVPTLRRLLGDLRGPEVRRVGLAPLSRVAVARLAGGTALTTAPLYTLTAGNPFYVTEALAVPEDQVPASVVDAVLGRVRRIDPAGQQALEQLSVVPSRAELPLVRTLLGDLDVLAGAERAGLLEVTAEAVRFRHELARQAVEGSLTGATRLARHATVLAALLAQDRPEPARVVHHAVGAADDATVVAHAPVAAERACAAGAQRQGAALYEQALERRGLLAPPVLAEVLEAYAWALYYADRRPEAVLAAADAVRAREDLGDDTALGVAVSTLAVQQWTNLDIDGALVSSARAVALLEHAGTEATRELATALTLRGAVLVNVDRDAEALEVLETARDLVDRHGPAALAARTACFHARARWQAGDPDGPALLDRALDLAVAAGNPEQVASTHANRVGLRWRYDPPGPAFATCLAQAQAYCDEHEMPTYAHLLSAYALLDRGRHGELAAAQDGLRAVLDRPDEVGALGRHVLPGLALLAVRTGADDAEALVEAAWDNAASARSVAALVPAAVAAAELGWLRGDPSLGARARGLVGAAAHAPRDRGVLSAALARLGDPVSPFPGCPEEYAATVRGEPAAAATAWERLGDPYEQGRALTLAEDPDLVAGGLEMLDRVGAAAVAAAVRRRLRDRGHRVPRGPTATTRVNPAGLTGRQMEILRLLSTGMSNAEIAARLVLSVRTVDHHVSAVLQKLGVASRREAVAAAARFSGDDESGTRAPRTG